MTPRGIMEIKGKGQMETHFLWSNKTAAIEIPPEISKPGNKPEKQNEEQTSATQSNGVDSEKNGLNNSLPNGGKSRKITDSTTCVIL